jgi:subtilisin family serine protease
VDDEGHGTYVAGVIGARNDGAGLVGVAPGTELYAVKVLGTSGDGFVSDIICGIEWVTAHGPALGIRVANMSLSGASASDALHEAIRRSVSAGTVYVVAAGNFARNIAVEIPAAYPEVLTVTAVADSDGKPGGAGPPLCEPTQTDDTVWTRSNYATRAVEIAHVVAAPGVCITSTSRGGGEETGTGTSAAAPHAAGVVALCMGEAGRPGPCAEMTPAEVIEQVRADAAANASAENGFLGDPLNPVGVYYGHLVSATDPTVRRIPQRPAPTPVAAVDSPQPSILDRTLELLALRIARRQDVDRLRVVVRLAEAGTVTARATVRLPGGAARLIRSRRARGQAAPGQTRRLRLVLRRPALRRIKRALRRGVRLRAKVTMTVSDLSGNARSKKARVRLTR